MQPFNTQFILSREYLAECYDESLPHGKNAKPNYIFPVTFFLGGAGLLVFTDEPMYLSITLIGIAAVELIHIYYRRAWWLARQMWGASANGEVALTIDNAGIRTKNLDTNTALTWDEIDRVIETKLGLILVSTAGAQQYLSKSLLPSEMINDILAKVSDQ